MIRFTQYMPRPFSSSPGAQRPLANASKVGLTLAAPATGRHAYHHPRHQLPRLFVEPVRVLSTGYDATSSLLPPTIVHEHIGYCCNSIPPTPPSPHPPPTGGGTSP